MNNRLDKFITVAVVLIFVAAILGFFGLLYTITTGINDAVKTNGLQGVVMQLWCGEKGCEQ